MFKLQNMCLGALEHFIGAPIDLSRKIPYTDQRFMIT
jgi:hypothetical protein